MDIKNVYLNKNKTWRIIVFICIYSFFLNLEGLHNWAQQKNVSKAILLLTRFTDAFNYFGQETGLNFFRSTLKSQFAKVKPTDGTTENIAGIPTDKLTGNTPLPSAGNGLGRELAAIDSKGIKDDAAVVNAGIEQGIKSDTIAENLNSLVDQEVSASPKLLLLGDSMLKSGLQMHLQTNFAKNYPEVEIVVKSQSGTGLSRPEVYDWVDYVKSLSAEYETMLIFLGTNDAQNFIQNKSVITFGSEEWVKEYALRLRALIDESCQKAKKVYWVGSLRMRSESFDKKMAILNSVAKKEIERKKSCGQYIGVTNWLSKNAKYVDHLELNKKSVKIRMEDGIHLSYWGAQLFTQKLIEQIAKKQ
jgi:lysophospholipase L1-like esterase